MFILYAIAIGAIVGAALRGDPRRLATVQFHWKGVVLAGFVFQVVLFSDAVAARIGDLGPILYVGSTVMVLAAVVRNHAIVGLPLIALGSVSNLAAILANGGYMPMSRDAAVAMGINTLELYSNSALLARPALAPLTDIFAMPRWMPFANVFSIGDVLIGVGVVWAIAGTMRRPTTRGSRLRELPAVDAARLWRAVTGRVSSASAGASKQLSIGPATDRTSTSFALWDSRRSVATEGQPLFRWGTVQGKPVVRRGTQSQGSS